MKLGTRVPLAAPLTEIQSYNLGYPSEVCAEVTGEFRPPRAGEWFVSGATPEAYLSAGGLGGPRYIARLRWDGDDMSGGDELLAAARAVIERWKAPLWKDVPATALFIQRLERAAEEFERELQLRK